MVVSFPGGCLVKVFYAEAEGVTNSLDKNKAKTEKKFIK